MNDVVLLDTTVYMNVLDIPGRNQHKNEVQEEIKTRFSAHDCFMLPLATVWETGAFISRISGSSRRTYSQDFVDNVTKAINGELPYKMTSLPDRKELLSWLNKFPDAAMQGWSFSDLSIVEEYKKACELYRAYRVRIWSFDSHLQGFCNVR
ncbi:MAG: hypothetical protein PHQ23_08685 [Candidatus Wallbacteria bacterium]|nr:hypothetical protein [Candidatus Wallbacteria bacterium]